MARGVTVSKRDVKQIINSLMNITTVNITSDDNSVSTISPKVSPRGGITSFSQYHELTARTSVGPDK